MKISSSADQWTDIYQSFHEMKSSADICSDCVMNVRTSGLCFSHCLMIIGSLLNPGPSLTSDLCCRSSVLSPLSCLIFCCIVQNKHLDHFQHFSRSLVWAVQHRITHIVLYCPLPDLIGSVCEVGEGNTCLLSESLPLGTSFYITAWKSHRTISASEKSSLEENDCVVCATEELSQLHVLLTLDLFFRCTEESVGTSRTEASCVQTCSDQMSNDVRCHPWMDATVDRSNKMRQFCKYKPTTTHHQHFKLHYTSSLI